MNQTTGDGGFHGGKGLPGQNGAGAGQDSGGAGGAVTEEDAVNA